MLEKTKPEKDIDYDGKWKVLVHTMIDDLLLLLLPKLHKDVDFTKEIRFLEQDLHKIIGTAYKKDDLRQDILAELTLKNGEKLPVLLHFEIESSPKATFPKRLFIYHYRLRDKYPNQKIVALALYVGEKTPAKYDRYEYDEYGTTIIFKFNAFRIKDWRGKENELLKSKNPFALAILACLYILDSKDNYERRLKFKWQLARLVIERNYSREKKVQLFEFIRLIMRVSQPLEQQFEQQVRSYYNKLNTKRMNQATSIFTPESRAFWRRIIGEMSEEDKQKLRVQVEKEVRADLEVEIKEELRKKVKEEVKVEVKAEVKEQVKEEVKAEVKEQVKEEVKAEVKEQVKEEVKAEVTKEMNKKILSLIYPLHKAGLTIRDIAQRLELDTEQVKIEIARQSVKE